MIRHRHNTHGLIAALIVLSLSLIWIGLVKTSNSNPTDDKTSSTSQPAEAKPEQPQFDKSKHSIDEASSLWVIVNKQRPLPDGYRPDNLVYANVPLRLGQGSEEMLLRSDAAAAAEEMFAATAKDGLSLMIASGFRSQSYQAGLYNSYVTKDGQAAADTYSARPGHSEHQTGLVFDIEPQSRSCEVEECFGDLPEGQWVAAHAHEYGFIIRYPAGKQNLTGYIYEPWHLRYVGNELAQELFAEDLTMEQFFGLAPATSYN